MQFIKPFLAIILLAFGITGSALCQTSPEGNFLTFNGHDQFLRIPDHDAFDLSSGESITIALRIKADNFNGIYRLLAKGNLESSGGRYELFTNNKASEPNLGLNLRNDQSLNLGSPYTHQLQAGLWVHLAWVYNAMDQCYQLYVDGTIVYKKTDPAIGTKPIENQYDLLAGCGYMGQGQPIPSFFWPGQLDELRIWSRALSAAEIKADSNASTPDEDGLTAAWDFEDLSENIAHDISGKGHDGFLTGYGVKVYETSLPAGIGNKNERLVGFSVLTDQEAELLTSVSFTLEGTTDYSDFERLKVFHCGTNSRFHPDSARLFGTAKPQKGEITITGQLPLIDGENYVWITADISADAKEGNRIGAKALKYTISEHAPVDIPAAKKTRLLFLTVSRLFNPGDAGSKSYRIPAIVTAPDGSLVTATDRRWNSSSDLPNHIDVLVRRSTDLGKTWSDPVIVAGENTEEGYGDPALVVNQKNGDILCLFASHQGLFTSTADVPIRINQAISHDNGQTWSPPEDLTSQIYGSSCQNTISKNLQAAFVTSGAAAQLSSGRLLAVLAVRETTENTISNFVMYSDDHGASWQVSTHQACATGDEAKVVELADGQVLMSIRHRGHRLFTHSHDQGITWDTPSDQSEITDPFCNGDLIRYTQNTNGSGKNRLLHSIPFATTRVNVSVMLSYDEGNTWPVKKTIYPGASAYSALCALHDGSIGIYLEIGEYDIYEMYFMRFSLDWLTNQADSLH